MSTTLAPQSTRQVQPPPRKYKKWIALFVLVVAGAAIALALILRIGSDEATFAYELDGSLAETGNGPAAREVADGSFGTDAYAYGLDGGLAIDVNLGETYTVEMRVRVDSENQFAKVVDFSDKLSDVGLYLFDGRQLMFWFGAWECPEGVVEISQGCRSQGTRYPLYGPAEAYEVGTYTTIRIERDGEAGTFEAYLDGVRQTWTPAGPWHSYDLYDTDPTEAELEALDRIDGFVDYNDQTTLFGSTLYLMTDDRATVRESSSGEIDYIRIWTDAPQ